jgi:cobyrinic acid a,c-diamide synthase
MMNFPRVAIAGLGGDSGKTFLTCGLLAVLKDKGYRAAPFKKGPDYIDPAWLKLASGFYTRNLDTWLMKEEDIIESFVNHAHGMDISVMEGNRGLFDGFDSKGTNSTAQLAKLLKMPVVLVFNNTKMTRTSAAIVMGCKMLDKELNLAGVVLNQIANPRHLKVAREAIEGETGIPVIGHIPRLKQKEILPSRHLGLVTPGEFKNAIEAIETVKQAVNDNVDIEKIIEIAKASEELEFFESKVKVEIPKQCKIGYLYDKAFSFYYQDNLDALEKSGAELVKISSIDDKKMPQVDALYIGGGFPESNILEISKNTEFIASLKESIESGLPVYAECGGLMYLTKAIKLDGKEYPLAGVFPVTTIVKKKPVGHGYSIMKVDKENPFYEKGTKIRGHEFHYSTIEEPDTELDTCMQVERGTGIANKRDGMIYKNTFAAYLHVHALASKEWAENMIRKAIEFKILNKIY